MGGNPAGPKAAVAVPLETIEANAALAKRAAALDHEQAVAVAKEVRLYLLPVFVVASSMICLLEIAARRGFPEALLKVFSPVHSFCVLMQVSKLGVEPRVASGADPLDPVDTVHDAYAILTGEHARPCSLALWGFSDHHMGHIHSRPAAASHSKIKCEVQI